MIFSVSNIAWKPEERLAAYGIMQTAGITGLEIAPGLFFNNARDPFEPDDVTAAAALAEIEAYGLSFVSMQSLLFGVSGASLFGDAAARAAFERGMSRAIELAARFGIPNLVFGSPVQRRIPGTMKYDEALTQAVEVFRCLGERAATAGTVISIEPNPAAYGTNFMTTLDEAVSFVAKVAHPAVTIILDLGAMHMNSEFQTVSRRINSLIPTLSHVHVSEPWLAPAPSDAALLAPVLAKLRSCNYARAVSIEMKRHDGGLETLRNSIAILNKASKLEET